MGAAAKALKVAHGKMYVKHFLSIFRINSTQKILRFNNNNDGIYLTYIVLIFN